MDDLPADGLRRAGSGRGGLLSGMAAVRLFSRDASVKRITSSARFRKGNGSGEERSTRAPVIFLARLCKNWKNGRMEKLMQALLIIDVQNDYFPGGRFELAGAVERLNGPGPYWTGSGKRGFPLSLSSTSTPVRTLRFSSRIPSARKSIRTLLPRGMSRLS